MKHDTNCQILKVLRAGTLSLLAIVLLFTAITSAAMRCVAASTASSSGKNSLFARENLVAWCIVPFDAKKRTPEARAEMLSRLGFTKFAYDYRAEHVPTFEAEIEALGRHRIDLTAWWFPTQLNAEARGILALFKQHHLHPQLWVMGGGEPTKNQAEYDARVKAEADRIRPIAIEAAKIDCKVGLYNHGGWFGEPENQIAIIKALNLPNVGIVYNLHHGHAQLSRLPQLLPQMLPYLYALNLNGMSPRAETGPDQILPLGQGDHDLDLLKLIRDSGYQGPIGILGHTSDDAEDRLRDNLDGLDFLVKQLEGKPTGPRPQPRTIPPRKTSSLPQIDSKASIADASNTHPAVPASLTTSLAPLEYDAKFVSKLAADAAQHGNASAGATIFCSARFACLNCHRVGKVGGAIGPELTDVGRRLRADEIIESVLWPKRTVKPEFTTFRVVLLDGRQLQGYKRNETPQAIVFFDPGTERTTSLKKSEIEELHSIGTLMPDCLASSMSADQRRDLIRFLKVLGTDPAIASAVRREGTVEEFRYDLGPVAPQHWPQANAPVNKFRLYDFYTKEATYFRTQPHVHLLPAYPGLDGGTFGHWGTQNEETWKDDRWNKSDLGTVLAGLFRGGNKLVAKGVCVRLGDRGEMATCFNPEALTYDALWQGGFLKFSAFRHGFLDGLTPEGQLLPPPNHVSPRQPFEYHGYYRFGRRVVFAYRVAEMEYLDSAWVSNGKFERTVAPASNHPMRQALEGGPPQWPQVLETVGTLGTHQQYAIDTIRVPFDNPWHTLFSVTDHDFLADGSAVLCTMQGDVWHVSGLDRDLKHIRWRRFATGLHQPLGLVVKSNQIYVLGRDQITCLHDINHDGEADFYECIANNFITSASGHDFICGLACDQQSRFYTASSAQGLLRISPEQKRVDVLATGFRNPDGLGLLPDDSVTVPCSEGEWTPASMICLVSSHSRSSAPPHFGYPGPRNNKQPSLPLAYLPRGIDNSSGGQIVVPDDRWGPLRGQLVHFSSGQCAHFLVLRDAVDGQTQGAIVPLVGEFRSGVHRGKFNPADGQLYASGLNGWGSYAVDDGCFERVRYTGGPVQIPTAFHVHENGVLLRFSQPVSAAQAGDLKKQFAQVWNYRYGPGYGSQEFAPSHPGIVGHEALRIAAVHAVDSHSIFLEMPDIQPVNQLHLLLNVDSGRPQELFVTVHRLDKPFADFKGYQPVAKTIAAHPMSVDFALLGRSIPNRWQATKPNSVPLKIAAGKNLTFSTRTLSAKRGQKLALTFDNPDAVPHNWVLIRPGTLQRVGEQANRFIADPEAVLHQYVPPSDDVLAFTDIVPPSNQFTIYFRAPRQPGRYPYLCTFPGHWMVMNGELIVE